MSIILGDTFNFMLYEHRDKEAGYSNLLQTSEQSYQAA
jgi:hypothetical protein